MTTFTSTLPDELLKQLNDFSKKLKMPKNKLIQNALSLYLDHLERAEYIQSFKKYANDQNIMIVAEEGMNDYLNHLDTEDEAR